MKILHIAPIGHIAEGIGSVLVRLMSEQMALGHDVRVVSLYENVIYKDLAIPCIREQRKLSEYLDSWCPDVVIFHSVFFIPYIGFYRLLKSRHIPYLVQMHGGLSKENYKKNKIKKWAALQLAFKRLIKGASAVIYLNQNEMNNCVVKKYNDRSLIIPNGCEKPEKVNIAKTPSNPIDLLYIGRIDMIHKGNDKLVEALHILDDRGVRSFKLTVYANPKDPDLGVFLNMIQDIPDLVEYKGPVYGDEKYKRLYESDMFILTSRYEGMPMGVLEALSYGLPCIVTPGTNMAEVIEDNNAGWATSFGSVDIANMIEQAISEYRKNPAVYRESARTLSEKYQWEAIAVSSVENYESAIKEN